MKLRASLVECIRKEMKLILGIIELEKGAKNSLRKLISEYVRIDQKFKDNKC